MMNLILVRSSDLQFSPCFGCRVVYRGGSGTCCQRGANPIHFCVFSEKPDEIFKMLMCGVGRPLDPQLVKFFFFKYSLINSEPLESTYHKIRSGRESSENKIKFYFYSFILFYCWLF